MMIIGLSGGIGHGKTTFAHDLERAAPTYLHFESSDLVIEVANEWRQASTSVPAKDDFEAINRWLELLPSVLDSVVHQRPSVDQLAITTERLAAAPEDYEKLFSYLDLMALHPERQQVIINAQTKAEFRPILQWLGGYLVKRVNQGVWFDEIVRRLQTRPDVALETVSGLRYPADAERIRNAGGLIVQISRPNLEESDKLDLTERDRDLIEPDISIQNDGSLEQLAACAKAVYEALAAQEAKASYAARDY